MIGLWADREPGQVGGGPPSALRRRAQAIAARVRSDVTRWRSDHLMRNSFFILLSTMSIGAAAFLFWAVVARVFTPAQVGIGSTLVTASGLIAYSSLLGFNQTFVRSIPSSKHPDDVINTGLILVTCAGVVLSIVYLLVVPAFVPQLVVARGSPRSAVAFVLLSAAAAANLASDAVFLAYRSAKYNFLIDGVLQSLVKLALPLTLVFLGSLGIFLASGVASLTAAVVSVLVLMRSFGFRPKLRVSRAVIRGEMRFSAASYVAHLLDMAPVLLVPIIVIGAREAADAAYFFMAFQIASVLYAVAYAVSQSLFVEGSYRTISLRSLAKRSMRMQAKVIPALSLAAAVTAPFVLQIIGSDYRRNGTIPLVILALSAPLVAVNAWMVALLKLSGMLRALVVTSLLHATATCGLVALWVHRGLTWVALAWLAGNIISCVGAFLPLWARERRLVHRQSPA